MALTKIKNTSLEDADLITLAGNDGTNLTGVVKSANDLSDLDSAVTALTNLGLTSTAAELNILDGVTSTAAELNILDGVTSTAAELNYAGGVTSAIQAQLDGKEDVVLSSTSGNVLTSDGSVWVSSPPAPGGISAGLGIALAMVMGF